MPLIIIPVLALIGVFLYWQLIIAEGTYLGRRVVALLYDWSAHVYDRIKAYDPGYEQWFLGLPLSRALAFYPDPLILDVAAGTGRLARTLFAQPGYRGRMVALDYSRRMLRQAVMQTRDWADRITFLWQDAGRLPFPADTFDAVSCLEALEFMPDPDLVLREMIRVLRPGGTFLTTNRIGKDARWLPGKTCKPDAFQAKLSEMGLEMLRTQTWQEDYDLIWGTKSGTGGGPTSLRQIDEILRCPTCAAATKREGQNFRCAQGHMIPIAADGVVEVTKAV
ncbi:MAG: class I SAM-dependent methyltransferase [Anaerolineae bacterium]|nr:class I SAM-dependent methyltransferase [Anaerolineae bacterium]